MAKYFCSACDHIYDEEIGDPEGGVPAGTLWQDVPEDWVCPDCGVDKSFFELLVEED